MLQNNSAIPEIEWLNHAEIVRIFHQDQFDVFDLAPL